MSHGKNINSKWRILVSYVKIVIKNDGSWCRMLKMEFKEADLDIMLKIIIQNGGF